MNLTNRAPELTTPVTQPAHPPASPANQAKRPFVSPQLVKQGKVATLTQDFGGSGIAPD